MIDMEKFDTALSALMGAVINRRDPQLRADAVYEMYKEMHGLACELAEALDRAAPYVGYYGFAGEGERVLATLNKARAAGLLEEVKG